MNHKLDTDTHVFFYEQEFYVLSNFSSFAIQWKGKRFDTSEAVYHWEKFPDNSVIQDSIQHAASAHVAFQIAQFYCDVRRPDWNGVKIDIMKDILRMKVEQHNYVREKLLQTGDRILVEDSWRDDFWGWGEHRDGENALGELWMAIRDELRRE